MTLLDLIEQAEAAEVVTSEVVADETDELEPEPVDEPGDDDATRVARRAAWEAKRAARVDRFEARAAAARNRSDVAYNRSNSYTAGIPMGQPILVGHHSESRHRNALKKSDAAMRQCCDESKKADYYESRAASAASNNAIFSDDPDAAEKLSDKIARLEQRQALMNAANKLARKNDRDGLLNLGFSESQAAELLNPKYSYEKPGFQSWQLSNNSANIRRLKQRLKQVEVAAEAETSEIEVGAVRIVDNVEENRLQIFFPGKPCDDVRKRLKSYGFRWSPMAGAWQRHRSNAATYYGKEIAAYYNEVEA